MIVIVIVMCLLTIWCVAKVCGVDGIVVFCGWLVVVVVVDANDETGIFLTPLV